jgi:cytochrome c
MRSQTPMKLRLLFSFMLTLSGAALLGAAEITLPDDTSRLKDAALPGYALATTYCYTCHSADYMMYQPSMTRAAWKASVTKMQKTFGAVIPDSAIDPIAEYLAKTYGAERGSGRSASEPAKSAPEKKSTRSRS